MAPPSDRIRHPTTSHQSHPSSYNIPGESQKPPPLESLDFHSGPSRITTALQAKGLCRKHKARALFRACLEPSHDCLDHGLRAPHEPVPTQTSPHILPHPYNQLHPPGALLPFPKSRVLLLLGYYLHLPLYRRMGVRLIPFFLEISSGVEKHHFVPLPHASPFT